jgi:hypothetical protein
MPRPSVRPFVALAGVVLAGLAFEATPATSQPPPTGGAPPPPPPPQNLQFFPKDIPRSELIGRMREFSFALGVRCDHCHVDESEGPNPRQDFASDEKPAKLKARAMLAMTKQINDDLMTTIPHRSTPEIMVNCATCHHGLPKPETLAERLTAAAGAGGADSVNAELTKLHAEADFGRFDVSEWGVNEAARALSRGGKRAEALAALKNNRAVHPHSEAIPSIMADIHVAMGDTADAVALLREIVAKNPENRRARQTLDRLTGAAPPAKH